MKKKETSPEAKDNLRPEYDLKTLLKSGVQGKYANRYREGTNLVLLAPDVARAFPTEEAVNDALRLVMRIAQIPVCPTSDGSNEISREVLAAELNPDNVSGSALIYSARQLAPMAFHSLTRR